MSLLWKWSIKSIAIGIFQFALLTGCGGDSDSSQEESTVAEVLSGLWIGTTEENAGAATTPTEIPTFVLFHNNLVYLLREDEAQLGTYTIEDNDLSTFTMDVYPYGTPDTDNEFYVGTDSNDDLILSALQATATNFVINYNTATRAGRIDVDIDSAQVSSIGISNVQGEWDTTDSTMTISSDGGFSGWNSATSCQWEGNLASLNSTLLTLQIQRENCTEFNVNGVNLAEGLAFIDGTGSLHFLATDASDILWMQFSSATATTTTETTEEAAP